MFKSLSLVLSLALPVLVSAHGYVGTITIDGKAFKGNVPNAKTLASGVRQINDVSPVKGAKNPDMNCGPDATIASDVLAANPGSKVSFTWNGGDNGNWPHNTGPILTYMASCGEVACNKFDSKNAKWFKIDQVGRNSDGSGWIQAEMMAGKAATVTIPKTLAAGNYLIRHEVIGLHLAESKGGAEFYPSCAQLKVGGNQTGKPSSNELVSFPGAYTDDDAGILFKAAFDSSVKYPFPGPSVAKLASTSSSDDSNNEASGSASASVTSSAPASSSTSTKNGGSCKKKGSSTAVDDAQANIATTEYRPRRISRIMRDLQVQ